MVVNKNINMIDEMEISPILLFVYNRPFHTKKTIEALQLNSFSNYSDLFIYSDGSKSTEDFEQVLEVREYIKNIKGFKSVKVIERTENMGLSANIINGVTDVINKYGTVIVLEDDIVTSHHFLSFMNQALNYYKNKQNVWHIGGWNNPLNLSNLDDMFFWRIMNCWGWATWSDRWKNYKKNPLALVENWNEQQIYDFNIDGTVYFWDQVISNLNGNINTWAIFWYATIFENNGLCLNTAKSYVENIGFDGSGIHCRDIKTNKKTLINLNVNENLQWPYLIEESEIAIKKLKEISRVSLVKKIWKKIKVLGFID